MESSHYNTGITVMVTGKYLIVPPFSLSEMIIRVLMSCNRILRETQTLYADLAKLYYP